MKKNELVDKALDEILYYAAPLAEAEMMDKFDDDINEDINFSKEHEEKMQKVFKDYKQEQFRQKIFSALKKVAIFIIITSVVGTVSILSVEAWQIRILNYIIEIKDNHSDINLKEEVLSNNSYKTDDIAFEYIPQGFSVQNTTTTARNLFIQFVNENNLYFSLDVNNIDLNLSIDTENADFRKILINDAEVLLSEKNNMNILVWNNDKYIFTLLGNIETSELIKIVEKIKK